MAEERVQPRGKFGSERSLERRHLVLDDRLPLLLKLQQDGRNGRQVLGALDHHRCGGPKFGEKRLDDVILPLHLRFQPDCGVAHDSVLGTGESQCPLVVVPKVAAVLAARHEIRRDPVQVVLVGQEMPVQDRQRNLGLSAWLGGWRVRRLLRQCRETRQQERKVPEEP